jgi:hypothetical protein
MCGLGRNPKSRHSHLLALAHGSSTAINRESFETEKNGAIKMYSIHFEDLDFSGPQAIKIDNE